MVAPYLAPIALGALGITATATAIAIATAVIGVALSLAVSFAFRALGVGAPSAKSSVGPPQVFRQAISNSFIVYGRRRLGGLLAFFHARQAGSSHFRYFVIAAAGHRCSGVVSWMLGDEIVTVDGGGMVTSGKYANAAWLWFQRGLAAETANATFVAECGGRWTTNHVGNDITAIYAKFQMTDAVVQAGMPNITAVVDGRDEIADPRTGTAGFTANGALAFYDWLLMAREEGGFGCYPDELPDPSWISAQANVCDEHPGGDPTIRRYELNGVITTGAAPSEIRDSMIVNMAGSYTYSGGKHLMRPGYWVPSSATLSEDDLAGPVQVSPFLPADSSSNQVQGTFIDPSAGYQSAPIPTQTASPSPTDIAQMDLDLAFTTNLNQGVRVARIMLGRAGCEKTVVWPMNIAGVKVAALDNVQLGSPRYGLDNYAFNVSKWGLSADYGVVLSLREENSDIYADPVVTAPAAPPSIVDGSPVLTSAELITIIDASKTVGLTFSIDNSAGAVSAAISNHTRIYADKSVAVTGTGGSPLAIGGAVAGDLVYIYYDDPARAGGAVAYHALVLAGGAGDASSADVSPTYPARHFVCVGSVPASGSSTSGGSDPGSGGGGSGACLVESTPLLMANEALDGPGAIILNGESRVGEWVWTRHHVTGEWCAAQITHQERHFEPVYHVSGLPLGTRLHRSSLGDEIDWECLHYAGAPAGKAWVVKRTVAEARTYFTPGGGEIREEGVLNHNVKPVQTL